MTERRGNQEGHIMFACSRAPILARAKLFVRDGRGVAALEFALVVPLLLMLYFVTMEVAQAIEANKKVGRVGSMVADLVTQQQVMSKNELEGIMRLGESTLQPYNRSGLDIEITAIEVTDETTPKVQVVWARKMENGSFSAGPAIGTPVTIPPALRIKGSFLIRAESKLNYRPVITWAASSKQTLGLTSAFDNIPMTETYYLRPRMSLTIPCADCY
jgi:Flp pilus assembly protein TadG